jgi:hypothetical protein
MFESPFQRTFPNKKTTMSGKLRCYVSFDVKEEDESDFLPAVKVVVENSKVREKNSVLTLTWH